MKTKNSEKSALFSIKCSRGALSIVNKIENWKNTKKKPTSDDEKEKNEVKLHAALVLNITYWAIYEPRRDTQHSGRGKGFNDRVSLNMLKFFISASNPGARKITCDEAKLRRNYNWTSLRHKTKLFQRAWFLRTKRNCRNRNLSI